jgi:tRNA threonylcarbamoyladenosine biosynthesis protein TsaB
MALILNIETATEVCSVALSENGIVKECIENTEGREHASLLTVYVDKLLTNNRIKASDLDAVAISMGPGSYTGLRIGVSAAKGICYATEKPLIAVSTLQSMASGFVNQLKLNESEAWFCPMIDARRLEVYTAFYDASAIPCSEISAEIITASSFSDILDQHRVYFFGNGSEKCISVIEHRNATFTTGFTASAKHMAPIAQKLLEQKEFKNVAYFEPFYLKDFVATVAKNKVI